ncbi:unnamed protein product [Parnassius mnemosyne]|uniref:MSV199 domain-containing protein n=1 Tax=Parnassius mnemosyne TaxID=213953 RepID=A0AAV1K9N7_9NEOP
MSLTLLNSNQDVRQWIAPLKLSYSEVCEKFGIDIKNDRRNAFFWNMMLGKNIIINDDLLSWCGYTGDYRNMKTNFMSLLKKNPHFKYEEIDDASFRKKRYIVLDTLHFESLLMQMRSRKAQEIRELYSFLKYISMQYMKYEKYFEEYRNELISAQNNQLTQSVHELKDLVLLVKSNADREIERAEQERLKAEEERRQAEKRHLTVSTKLDIIRKRIRTEVVDQLRTEIAPLVAPLPINRKKDRCLALIGVIPNREWYIVRRQRESFEKAICVFMKRNPNANLVKRWRGLAHSIDIGNCIKLRMRNLKWFARGNILRIVDDASDATAIVVYSDQDIVDAINAILEENCAIQLSEKTERLLNTSSESSQSDIFEL